MDLSRINAQSWALQLLCELRAWPRFKTNLGSLPIAKSFYQLAGAGQEALVISAASCCVPSGCGRFPSFKIPWPEARGVLLQS